MKNKSRKEGQKARLETGDGSGPRLGTQNGSVLESKKFVINILGVLSGEKKGGPGRASNNIEKVIELW